MKPFYTFLFLICFIKITAQITVDNATFPNVGDTLYTSIDNLPTGIAISSTGANQVWDFSSLEAPFSQQVIFRDVAEGEYADYFPHAQMVTIGAGQTETYYGVDNNIYELFGYSGADPIGLGVDIVSQVNGGEVLRRSPSNYLDIHDSSAASSTSFSAQLIPEFILEELPITPDSLRIRIESKRHDVVDAWGELTIPGGTFEVLREKRVEYVDRRLDAKLGGLPWTDITDILALTLPGYFGVDTLINYHFFSKTSKEPIAVVNMDPTESLVQSVQYKTIDAITSAPALALGKPDIIAYPNPAIDNARFSFANLSRGQYKLKIFNILGLVVWKSDYFVMGSKTVSVDFTDFRKGTYLYSLQDEAGNTIATKRLLIIRP